MNRELVERGHDVWIFDLKEDTHRLDLVLDPEKRSRVHFVAGDVADLFVAALGDMVPTSTALITHGDRQLPIAFDLDDSILQAQLGPIHRTSLHDGIAETYRRFLELRDQGRLDLSDWPEIARSWDEMHISSH